MISNWRADFRIAISLRLVLIFLTMVAIGWLALREAPLVFSLIGLNLLLLLQIALLFQSLQKIYAQLEDFFTCLRFQDTTRQIQPVFFQGKKLAQLWQEIQTDMQQLRERNESLLRYYSVLLEKVPVPLVRLQEDKIELINSAARQLFQRNQLSSLQELRHFGEDFALALIALQPGDQQLVSLQLPQQTLSLAASATSIQTPEGTNKIISLQVIQRELDRQQIDAWQKLVQVLSHEIMNSMTPINSLSNTAQELLESYQQNPAADLLTDAREALSTVSRRSEHLMDFVQAYRTVAQPLHLDLRPQSLRNLLQSVATLFARDLERETISLQIEITPEHLHSNLDAAQIEQALINLIKNAIEALCENPDSASGKQIYLRAYIHPQGKLVIDVVDNGPGIEAEKRAQVFVPFYTSKRTGTGIGLFVVQQIMQAHGGSVNYIAQPQGSCFRLMF
jgi:two-component system, NtrC family, nitrogen regulation sensor histidine kinase NtrY